MNFLSIWTKQAISVYLMSHYIYLTPMKQGSPWPHGPLKFLWVKGTCKCTSRVVASHRADDVECRGLIHSTTRSIPRLQLLPDISGELLFKFSVGHVQALNKWVDGCQFIREMAQESFIPEVEKAPNILILELYNENNIILYTLLPNATHLIQPLDLSLMGSINYHKCMRKWLQNNLGTVYNKNAFIEVFVEVHKKAATVENTVVFVNPEFSMGPNQS